MEENKSKEATFYKVGAYAFGYLFLIAALIGMEFMEPAPTGFILWLGRVSLVLSIITMIVKISRWLHRR
ncbi:MAG: hypothetical protein ACR2QU_06525 [Gammaproteobacteria bacterium]